METLEYWSRDIAWSSIPTDVLRAELSRRNDVRPKPKCGSGEKGSYDTPLHVFALFLILVVSTLACAFPLFSRRLSTGRKQGTVVFICQHVGTGVLMATAFVHLLPTAFESLTDPCLPWFFSQGYKPLAGFIAMVFALGVVAMESYLRTRGAGHSHSHHQVWQDDDDNEDGMAAKLHSQRGEGFGARRAPSRRPTDIAMEDLETQGLVAGVSPLPGSTPTMQPSDGKGNAEGNGLISSEDDGERESLDLELHLDELGQGQSGNQTLHPVKSKSASGPGPTIPQGQDADEQKRLLLQCLLLEAGILFHSVFIGMALSVATGPTFTVFLLAIAFHQAFEGLALGSRIAAIQFPRSSPRPWLMVLAYGTTTPLGQAIGLLVHNLYDPLSQTGLLMVGFMNAISSGLLLFAGLVQLLAEDFLSDESYQTLRGRRRVHAFIAVVCGSSLMAGVGALA